MSDLVGNHIVGFPTRRLIYVIDLDFSRTWNFHYENTPIQCTEIFKVVKNEKFSSEKFCYFSYFCSKHRL